MELSLSSHLTSGTHYVLSPVVCAGSLANRSDLPANVARSVTCFSADGERACNLSSVVHRSITITEANNKPGFSLTINSAYRKNSAATLINSNIVLSDVDTGTLLKATVSISNYVSGEEELYFTPNSSTGK